MGKPFECKNCPQGYFLRETKQIEIYKDTRREFERYACCNDRECICDISNECPKNYFRPRGEIEKCCHELTIYKNGECLPKYQSEPLVPPTVTRAVSTRTVPPTTTEKPRPKCKEKYVWNPDGSGECKFKCQYDIPSEGPIWVDDSSKCPKCRPNWAFDFMTGHCRQCPCQYRSRALFQWDLCSSCPDGYELDNFECRKICKDMNSHPVQSDIRSKSTCGGQVCKCNDHYYSVNGICQWCDGLGKLENYGPLLVLSDRPLSPRV